MIVNVRPRTLRTRLALIGLGALAAAGVMSMPEAHADGILSSGESAYVKLYHSAVCETVGEFPTTPGVLGVAQAVIDDGWAADSAVDIINASVKFYCPSLWPVLVAVGNEARATNTSTVWQS